MGWADFAVKALQSGNTTTIRPTGNSMKGKIESGSKVVVEPVSIDDVEVGDIVLCKVKGKQYLHLVKAKRKSQVLIGNNRGFINGWTSVIYGKVTHIDK